jgi:vacuolar-type H+-ATPase subunit E/Vma4
MRREHQARYPHWRRKQITRRPLEEAEMEQEDELEEGGDGLEQEIEMLRGAMRDLVAARRRAATLDEKVRIVQTISLVGERLAQMLLAEKKLSTSDGSQLEQWLRQMANEVLEEKGWGEGD